MAFNDAYSTIDDDFAPIHYGPAPGKTFDENAPPWAIQGPQSGRWEVGSGAASAIDDSCPTVWDFGPRTHTRSGPTCQEALSANVARKLAKGTAHEKKAERLEIENASKPKTGAEQNRRAADEEERRPRGFHVAKLNNLPGRGVKVVGKNGKQQVVQAPKARPAAVERKHEPQGKQAHVRPRKPSPQPAPKPESSVSNVSNASRLNARPVRIAGKHGEEAFIEIPVLTPTSDRAPTISARAASKTSDKQRASDVELLVEADKMRRERIDSERSQSARTAAHALMSGALPTPAGTPSDRSGRASRLFVAASVPASKHTSANSSREKAGSRPATVFAGTGWVSPHPLSRAATEVASLPQSAIVVNGEKITYEDWKSMRSGSEVRNEFMRASSVVSDRVYTIAASIAQGSQSGSVSGSGGVSAAQHRPYQASVESYRGSPSPSPANLQWENGGQASRHSADRRRTERRSTGQDTIDWALPEVFNGALG